MLRPDHWVGRTRNGMPRLSLVSLWAKCVLLLPVPFAANLVRFRINLRASIHFALTDLISSRA